MTKNQKIALGCGGAGCLGLIAVAIAGAAVYLLVYRQPAVRSVSRNYNVNVNLNDNSSNANDDSTPNVNASSNTSNSNSTSSTSASSLSDDDKHRLYHAAQVTGDTELINRVNVKLGLVNEDFTPGEEFDRFVAAHVSWLLRNTSFTTSINTPEKGRAYVNEHFPE
ncbi:MAG TPA: hypothetical protein VJ749_04030 [Pyrinomonadaceae bacterium]|jgi:hypothetical protein|nr:hypothetical protein [Pyrinomonadaceae bacterium]